MSKPNYRVIVTFDGERKLFTAHAPELEHCTAEGATRAEAIGRAEEEIDAQLANMLSHGSTPPRAVDEETFSGEISAKISKTLHRDLAYQARTDGVELDQFVGELLASAVEARKHTTRVQRSGNRQPTETVPHDNIGNRSDGGGAPRPRGNFGGRGYSPQILDDRANFIEYVRGLENNGGFPQRGGGGGGGGPGGSGAGDRGGDRGGGRRRRGRGGTNGGGGGNGGPRPQGQGFQGGSQGQHQGRNGNGQSQSSASSQGTAPQAGPQAPSSGSSGHSDDV